MSTMDTVEERGEFFPTKVIVLSELPTREKEKYYQLLASNNAKFIKHADGRYVANVRLLAPNVKKVENIVRKKDVSNYSLTFQERLKKLKENGFINVRVVGVEPFDYNTFPRFTALIAFNGETVRPKVRPLSWVMKIVEDIYDYRFSHEKNDVEREEDSPSYDLMLLIFPVFVVRRLGTNVGLKQLMDQTCWDLLYNTYMYRRDYLELEIFGRFLQEFYDHDDLLFYLYVRSVISKVLHVNFKTRWSKSDGPGRQPKSLWMSYRECYHIAKIVFGADNEGMLRNFMNLITPQMVGQDNGTTDSRRMEITEYLHLSVVGYHHSQTEAASSNAEGTRFLVPIPGQTIPTIPAPVPESEASYTDDGSGRQQQQSHQYVANAAQQAAEQYHQQMPMQQDETSLAAAAAADRLSSGRRYTPTSGTSGGSGGSRQQQQKQMQAHYDSDEGAYELQESDDDLVDAAARGGAAASHQQYYEVGDDFRGDDGQFNLEHLAASRGQGQTLEEQQQHEEDGAGELNEFEALQAQRESEFMAFLCQPLAESVPREIAEMIEADLSDRLHQTVALYLEDKQFTDLDTLDNFLVEFLGLEQLRLDMEATRDEIVDHMMSEQIQYTEDGYDPNEQQQQ